MSLKRSATVFSPSLPLPPKPPPSLPSFFWESLPPPAPALSFSLGSPPPLASLSSFLSPPDLPLFLSAPALAFCGSFLPLFLPPLFFPLPPALVFSPADELPPCDDFEPVAPPPPPLAPPPPSLPVDDAPPPPPPPPWLCCLISSSMSFTISS